ncbi:MAG: IS3 family transposase [Candidatus Anammoxibacter sp.]
MKGKLLSPSRKTKAVVHVKTELKVSERRACKALSHSRASQRYKHKQSDKDRPLREAVLKLAMKHKRYGYRQITNLLKHEGWQVNRKRVHRIWKAEGLQISKKVRKRRRFGSSINSCISKKAACINQVVTYDFIFDQTEGGSRLKMLTILDEYTRECLNIDVERKITSIDVISTLEELFSRRGAPSYIRSDNGPEFIAAAVRKWLTEAKVETLYIEPGSPWENGYVESFHNRFRYELLDIELFGNLREAKVIVEQWRLEYRNFK